MQHTILYIKLIIYHVLRVVLHLLFFKLSFEDLCLNKFLIVDNADFFSYTVAFYR